MFAHHYLTSPAADSNAEPAHSFSERQLLLPPLPLLHLHGQKRVSVAAGPSDVIALVAELLDGFAQLLNAHIGLGGGACACGSGRALACPGAVPARDPNSVKQTQKQEEGSRYHGPIVTQEGREATEK